MWYVVCVLLSLAAVYVGYYVIKFSNPYKLTMIFGKKGCGKTSTMCMLCFKYLKKGWTVYSTEPLPGAYHFNVQDLGDYHFPEKTVVLIDEVGMIWDNRQFKNFRTEVRDWFKYQRHAKCRVYLFSQTFDIDLKLRNLTDDMYMMVNVLGVLSYGKRIRRRLVVVKPSPDAESRIADELIISPFFTAPFGGRMFVWLPRFAKFFDSYSMWEMPDMKAKFVEYPDCVPPSLLPKSKRKTQQRRYKMYKRTKRHKKRA